MQRSGSVEKQQELGTVEAENGGGGTVGTKRVGKFPQNLAVEMEGE